MRRDGPYTDLVPPTSTDPDLPLFLLDPLRQSHLPFDPRSDLGSHCSVWRKGGGRKRRQKGEIVIGTVVKGTDSSANGIVGRGLKEWAREVQGGVLAGWVKVGEGYSPFFLRFCWSRSERHRHSSTLSRPPRPSLSTQDRRGKTEFPFPQGVKLRGGGVITE